MIEQEGAKGRGEAIEHKGYRWEPGRPWEPCDSSQLVELSVPVSPSVERREPLCFSPRVWGTVTVTRTENSLRGVPGSS